MEEDTRKFDEDFSDLEINSEKGAKDEEMNLIQNTEVVKSELKSI